MSDDTSFLRDIRKRLAEHWLAASAEELPREYLGDLGRLQRLIIGTPGDANSPLNSPWGIAVAPSSFGELSGLLLVGNFGDGKINAFNPTTGAFVKTLTDAKGDPLVIDGLWALAFGNGSAGFDPSKLYFTAGPNEEANGLFGSLGVIPEPGTVVLLGAGLMVLFVARHRHDRPCQAS